MALQVVVTEGVFIADNTPITYAMLRALARPVVTLSGAVDASAIPDLSLTNAKLANATIDLEDKAVAGSIATALYADGSITPAKVAPGAYFYADGVYATGVYGVTITPAPAAYAAGQIFRFKADTTNTGAVDLNFNSLGAKNLFKQVSKELAAGDIQADQLVEVLYDGTQFQLLSPVGQPDQRPVQGTAKNLVVKQVSATSVDIDADELILKDAAGVAFLASSVDLTAAITTAGANGLDTGAEAASTWYYAWVIYKPSTGTTAALLSVSSTAPTLPTDYTFKALVGCVRNDASSNFIAFYQNGNSAVFAEQVVFTAKAAAVAQTLEILASTELTAFQAAIPPIAKSIAGNIGSVAGQDSQMGVAADSNGFGQTRAYGPAFGADSWGFAVSFTLTLKTNNIYWKGKSSAHNRFAVCGYTL